jgi:hypothetical protein
LAHIFATNIARRSTLAQFNQLQLRKLQLEFALHRFAGRAFAAASRNIAHLEHVFYSMPRIK